MAIIVSKGGRNACVVHESGVDDESQLQRYVFDNPESLPVHDIKENARLMVVGREFPTSSGPIDVLAIDADGDIYVIETKLYKNADKRLVVAQVLDYGAALWRGYADAESFIDEVDRQIQTQRGRGLEESLADFFRLDEDRVGSLVEGIKSNLQNGSIRFVVLMDRLHDRLKDLILFLNQRSGFNVYAVEMEFYRHDGLEIVIPKLFGTEAVKTTGSAGRGGRTKWDETSFFDEAATELDATQLAAVRKLYDFAGTDGRVVWGTGKGRGRFSAWFPEYDDQAVYYVSTDGELRICTIPLPKFSVPYRDLLTARRAALHDAGIDVAEGGRPWAECCNYELAQWVPHVDRLIDVFRRLMASQTDTADLRDLREAKQLDAGQPTVSLGEAKRRMELKK